MSLTAPALNLRETILESARKLFAAEGYQSVSMRRIGQEAGCSPMAVYRHFASKQELLLSICEESFAHMMRNLERPASRSSAGGAVARPHGDIHPLLCRASQPLSSGVSRRGLRGGGHTFAPQFAGALPKLVAECLASSGAAVNSDAYFLTLLACMHGAILLLISGQKLPVPREVFLAELIGTATEVFNRCP